MHQQPQESKHPKNSTPKVPPPIDTSGRQYSMEQREEVQQEQEFIQTIGFVQDTLDRLAGLTDSRNELMALLLEASGHVFACFKSYNPKEINERLFDHYFGGPLMEVQNLADQVREFKDIFNNLSNDISKTINHISKFNIEVKKRV